MRYYAVTPHGRFGPADETRLAEWARDGRILPSTILEEEGSGRRIEAGSAPGLTFTAFTPVKAAAPLPSPLPPSPTPPPPGLVSPYRRPDWAPPLFLDREKTRKELGLSFVFAFLGPLVAIFSIYGVGMSAGSIYCGMVAMRQGYRLGAVGLVLGIVSVIAAIAIHFILRFSR